MPAQFSTPKGDALRTAKTQAGANPIDNITLQQALTYLNANVTDLASAKTYLRELTKKVFVQERRLDQIEAALRQYRQNQER